jgi:acyl-CoA thioester hydrolase
MKYTNKQFVRWDDLDAFGHLNNAKYLTLIQEARFQWSFAEPKVREEAPTMIEMVVGRAEVDFLAPIYEGGRYYDVALWVESIGGASFKMGYEISGEDGTLHARVQTIQVAIDMETKKSRRISDTERAFLSQYLIS